MDIDEKITQTLSIAISSKSTSSTSGLRQTIENKEKEKEKEKENNDIHRVLSLTDYLWDCHSNIFSIEYRDYEKTYQIMHVLQYCVIVLYFILYAWLYWQFFSSASDNIQLSRNNNDNNAIIDVLFLLFMIGMLIQVIFFVWQLYYNEKYVLNVNQKDCIIFDDLLFYSLCEIWKYLNCNDTDFNDAVKNNSQIILNSSITYALPFHQRKLSNISNYNIGRRRSSIAKASDNDNIIKTLLAENSQPLLTYVFAGDVNGMFWLINDIFGNQFIVPKQIVGLIAHFAKPSDDQLIVALEMIETVTTQ